MTKMWLDVETTGLDSKKHGIIQLACIDDKSGEKFAINMKPFEGCVYDKEAEKIHGKSKKTIATYANEEEAFLKFIGWLDRVQDGKIQFSIAGYNSRFDMDFIIALFKRNTVSYWSYFDYYDVDVYALVKILDLNGTHEGQPSKKLSAICQRMNIKLKNAHDALYDIQATRKLYKKIMKKYIK